MGLRSYIDANAAMAHRKPTLAQKEAGNYAKGHVRIHGLDIAIENARGTSRNGVDPDGKKWSCKLPCHYGYIKGTKGADGDHVDVYLGPHVKSPRIFVVDQIDADTRKFDEHKSFVGFTSKDQVLRTYRKAFSDGRADDRMGKVHEMTIPEFKEWLRDGDQTKPLKRASGGRIPMANGGFLSDDDIGLGATSSGGGLLSDSDMGFGAPPNPHDDEPADHGLSKRQKLSPIEKAINPVTSYPETYSRMNRESREQISSGIDQLSNPKSVWDATKGVGNVAFGGLGYVTSPINAAYRTIVGQPIEDVTGIPREYTEFAAQLATPGIGLPRAGKAPVTPAVSPKPPTIGDFDVPLTVGEATRDFGKIAEERAALRGGRGDRAQDVAQGFMEERNAALEEARQGIGRGLDRFGQNIVSDPHEAGALVSRAMQDSAEASKAHSKNLYGKFEELPGEMDARVFEGISQRIKSDLSLGDNPVIIDEKTTPFAARALQDIEENINRLKVQNKADPLGQPDPQNIIGINLKGVDQTRKRLLTFARDAKKYPPDADTRAAQAVINSFDNQVESAISRGLFSGDDRALQYLKDARAAYSNYRKTFTPQGPGDDVGRTIQKILGRGIDGQQATPTEVANYLYGSANVGSKGLSARLSQRLKTVLGEDSPEWDGIRQGLWSRLTQSTAGRADWGPQKISERVSEFVNGTGKPLAESMFSPAEREVMTRYSELLKKLVPPPGAVNYSNNLPMLNRLAEGLDKHVGTIIGAKIGGIPGAVAGYAAGKGSNMITQAANARRISKLMPTIGQSVDRWQRAQAAASRSGEASTPSLTAASLGLAKALQPVGFDYTSTLRQLQGSVPSRAQDEQQQPEREVQKQPN